jgi:hypothetical protein
VDCGIRVSATSTAASESVPGLSLRQFAGPAPGYAALSCSVWFSRLRQVDVLRCMAGSLLALHGEHALSGRASTVSTWLMPASLTQPPGPRSRLGCGRAEQWRQATLAALLFQRFQLFHDCW